ncbi:MAG: peptidylprolyl isomerase [Capnocytophaga sp.]|nr:peptidylprolyl isomerase [Capnocytophaga sp.]
MIRRFLLGLSVGAILVAVSCKKDDEDSTTPPRDYTEVADENDADIIAFMQTHFYNYEDFQNPSSDFDYEVTIDTISGNNSGKTPLIDQAQTIDLHVFDANSNRILHKLYYIPVQEGSGKQSSVADSVFVAYKGMLLNGTVFDSNDWMTSSNWMDLLGNVRTANSGMIKGFREGIALLKDSASDPIINSDGTFTVPDDYGMGILIFPSGLGYFNSTSANIPAYSPLVFVIKLIKTKNADHDHDGIPSINEIEHDEYGVVTYTDCDGDGIPDYLDADPCQ